MEKTTKPYLTLFVDKNLTQKKIDKDINHAAINELGKVISLLEYRIQHLEKTLCLQKRPRAIKIVEQ